MLSEEELKIWLHTEGVSRPDKLLLILATYDKPCSINQIREKSRTAGLKIPNSWNPSKILLRTNGLAIRTHEGWEITEKGRNQLREIGALRLNPVVSEIARDLRIHLSRIANKDTRNFVEEAIKCYESGLFRSAVVMSWLAAVAVLHELTISSHLSDVNFALKQRSSKVKKIQTIKDLERMREAEFLDLLVSASVIGKNVKTDLKACLDRRNGCGHPNEYKIGENIVTSHIETLLLNVFAPYAS